MPLKLRAPREGKTPSYSIRGTYLGVRVEDKTCGTDRLTLARKILKRLEQAIERGEYPPKPVAARDDGPTFLSAAVAYVEAGGGRRYIERLCDHFGSTPLADIDQAAVDEAAVTLHPNCTPATRNTCVYTPVLAILHHAKLKPDIARPIGAKGRVITAHLLPPDAGAIIRAADAFDLELGLLLRFLLYTGCRLGEALALRWENVDLDRRHAFVGLTKNGDPRSILLREDLRDALAARKADAGRIFRFRQGGHLKHQLVRAKLAALGFDCPARRPTGWRAALYRTSWVNFHTFRHTWATWMRQHAGADAQGLVATGNWRDRRSAERYAHVVPHDEWQRVDNLPAVGGIGGGKTRDAG